jgi:hypothetical protein
MEENETENNDIVGKIEITVTKDDLYWTSDFDEPEFVFWLEVAKAVLYKKMLEPKD